jgi:hypothetical protein
MSQTIGMELVPPLHRTFDPDEALEFHAARLVILLEVCGHGTNSKRIDGRTKLAKLDFFLRYPKFLEKVQEELVSRGQELAPYRSTGPETEAPMIRYRYGPWDPRYRDFVAYLESRGLVRIVGTTVEGFSLTAFGRRTARQLLGSRSFAPIVERANAMVGNLADWTGSALKDFIYEIFDEEVGQLSLRMEIQP